MNERNARFWTWINGDWAKITLRPEQSLEHYTCAAHDEGWSSEATVWYYNTETKEIERETTHDGRDCDGRMTTEYDCFCPVAQLRDRECDKLMVPQWERGNSRQRDYSAEAMGY